MSANSRTILRRPARTLCVVNIKVTQVWERHGSADNPRMWCLYRPHVWLVRLYPIRSATSKALNRQHPPIRAFTSQAFEPFETAEMGKEKDKVPYQLKTPKGTKDCTVHSASTRSPD